MLPLAEGQAKIVDHIESKKHHLIMEENGQNYYAEHFFYDGKVYIFGGGHLAQELVPLLSHLDFTCIVADDREEFYEAGTVSTGKRSVADRFSGN